MVGLHLNMTNTLWRSLQVSKMMFGLYVGIFILLGYCTVTVVREMGARGAVSIPIMTKPGSAKGKGDDYEDIDEILHFEDGESR